MTVFVVAMTIISLYQMRLNYCSESEYFYVADSIVFPAGTDLGEARELARRSYTTLRGSENVKVDYEINTFIGKRDKCSEVEVW